MGEVEGERGAPTRGWLTGSVETGDVGEFKEESEEVEDVGEESSYMEPARRRAGPVAMGMG